MSDRRRSEQITALESYVRAMVVGQLDNVRPEQVEITTNDSGGVIFLMVMVPRDQLSFAVGYRGQTARAVGHLALGHGRSLGIRGDAIEVRIEKKGGRDPDVVYRGRSRR